MKNLGGNKIFFYGDEKKEWKTYKERTGFIYGP